MSQWVYGSRCVCPCIDPSCKSLIRLEAAYVAHLQSYYWPIDAYCAHCVRCRAIGSSRRMSRHSSVPRPTDSSSSLTSTSPQHDHDHGNLMARQRFIWSGMRVPRRHDRCDILCRLNILTVHRPQIAGQSNRRPLCVPGSGYAGFRVEYGAIFGCIGE